MGIKNATAWLTFNLEVIFFTHWENIMCGRIFTAVINEMFNFHTHFIQRYIIKRVLCNREGGN